MFFYMALNQLWKLIYGKKDIFSVKKLFEEIR